MERVPAAERASVVAPNGRTAAQITQSQTFAERLVALARHTAPAQVLEALDEGYVQPQGGERLVEIDLRAVRGERRGQAVAVADSDRPLAGIVRNGIEVTVGGKGGGGGFCSPPRNAGDAVGSVADQSEKIGDG